MSTISQHDFHALPEVMANIEVEKANPYGSKAHRGAHIAILDLAKSHGVDKYFESLEDYDESASTISANYL